MSSQEIQITITPQQAVHGVILSHPLPTGIVRLRIPPSRDGDLVRARVGTEELLLRIHVAGTPGPPPPPPQPGRAPKSGARGWLMALGAAAGVLVAFLIVSDGDEPDSKPSATALPSYSASPSPTLPTFSATPTRQAAPTTRAPRTTPAAPTEPAAPTPFDRGTCLNGELPDSTTAQRVSGVEEVSCSASDAHYRVIESIPGTSDLERCSDNPRTEYAFSYRYTLNGSVINQYVYCLVGIGAYAR